MSLEDKIRIVTCLLQMKRREKRGGRDFWSSSRSDLNLEREGATSL